MSLDEKLEIARLYTETSLSTAEICTRLGVGESSLYRIVQAQGIPLRGRKAATRATILQPARASRTRRTRSPKPDRETVSPAVSETGASGQIPRGRVTRRLSAAESRTPAAGTGGTLSSSNVKRFRIRYQGERVFEAPSIQDALRQVESLGASEIVEVAREH